MNDGYWKPGVPTRKAGREPGTCSQAAGTAFLPGKDKRAYFQNADKPHKKLCLDCEFMLAFS